MENILIVDPSSTGINYINDVVNRNYHPVVIYELLEENHNPFFDVWRDRTKKKYKDVADFIDEDKDFDKTVELVKKYNPKVIVPGSEGGVVLAMKLIGALGLPGNDVNNIPNFTRKDCMQESLKRYGIRHIKGELVSTLDEALAFFDLNKLKACVVKPTHGAGSVGVRMCDSRDELITNFNELQSSVNMFGEDNAKILVQEKINGTEYVVNTVSYNGVHRLASIWRYEKKEVEGGGKAYDYCESINTLETGCTRLVKYAFDTLDAIGFTYGAVHGEYMVDENGPVLIETNCRPMGGSMSADYVDRIFGHHETDNILDTYLNPEWHMQKAKEPYKTYEYAVAKDFIVKQDTNVNVLPILTILSHMKSFHSSELSGALGGKLTRTVDLETSGGTINLVHPDPLVLDHDLQYLRKIEKDYFGVFFNNDVVDINDMPKNMDSVEDIINKYNCVGSVLTLTNETDLKVNSIVASESSINDIHNMFNYGIMDIVYDSNKTSEEYVDLFYRLVDHIRKGGKIIIPERAYWYLPHTVEGVEAICEAVDLTIEAPTTYDKNVVIVTKK